MVAPRGGGGEDVLEGIGDLISALVAAEWAQIEDCVIREKLGGSDGSGMAVIIVIGVDALSIEGLENLDCFDIVQVAGPRGLLDLICAA